MLFERVSSTDSIPLPKFIASVQHSPKLKKTFKTTRVSAGELFFFEKRQRSNPPEILMNRTTVNYDVPRILRKLNAENLPVIDPCIIAAE